MRRLATAISDPDCRIDLLLATGPGVDSEVWRNRLASLLPARRVETVALGADSADPALFLGASKVAVVLPCDRLVDLSLRDAADEILGSRPPDSWVLIYTGAEEIEDEAHLEVLERGARQIAGEGHAHFLPTHPEASRPTPEVLAARLAEDERRLDRWIGADPPEPAKVAAWSLDWLLERAENRARRAPVQAAESPDRRALRETRGALNRSRRRLAERLQADFRNLRDEIDLAQDPLDRSLTEGLARELEAHLAAGAAAGGPGELEGLVAERVRVEVNRFAEQCTARVASRCRELAEDGRQLLRGVDWSWVDGVDTYPGEILQALTASRLDFAMDSPPESLGSGASDPRQPRRFGLVILLASGSALTAGASTLIGLPTLWVALSSASGALGAGRFHERRHRAHRRQSVVEAAVHRLRPFLGSLRGEVRQALHLLRRHIEEELSCRWRELEERLEAVESGAPEPAHETPTLSERLAAIRADARHLHPQIHREETPHES